MVSERIKNDSGPVLIWGAGAVGGSIGAALARSGIHVQMVDVNIEHCQACSEIGLKITGPVETYLQRVPCVTPNNLTGTFHRIILAVKGPSTADAVNDLVKHLPDEGYVLSAQNGLAEHYLSERIGVERVMGGFVNFGADWLGPGEILYGNRGAVVIGEVDGTIQLRTQAMQKLIQCFEPNAIVTSNIFGYLWGKMCYGAMLFATALTGDSMAKNFADPSRISTLVSIGKEVIATAVAEGVSPESFDGFQPLALMPDSEPKDAAKCMAKLAEFNLKSAKSHSGIHRDLAVRRRATEVDFQPGLVVKIASKHGVPTPLLKKLVELIHNIEEGKINISAETFRLLQEEITK